MVDPNGSGSLSATAGTGLSVDPFGDIYIVPSRAVQRCQHRLHGLNNTDQAVTYSVSQQGDTNFDINGSPFGTGGTLAGGIQSVTVALRDDAYDLDAGVYTTVFLDETNDRPATIRTP